MAAASLTVERGEFVSIVGRWGAANRRSSRSSAASFRADHGRVEVERLARARRTAECGDRLSELLAAAVVLGARKRAAGRRRRVSGWSKERQREQASRHLEAVGLGNALQKRPASSRAACGSGSPSPARSRRSRRFCFSTNRLARSMRSLASRCSRNWFASLRQPLPFRHDRDDHEQRRRGAVALGSHRADDARSAARSATVLASICPVPGRPATSCMTITQRTSARTSSRR